MSVATVTHPTSDRLPIVLSIPHSGIQFPSDLVPLFIKEIVAHPPDTDWHVEKLYQFASELGITVIAANYSRYVVDLNRSPSKQSLYQDKRLQTAIVPQTTFLGEPLYLEKLPDAACVGARIDNYFWPYYQQIEALLQSLREMFPHVLLFDAHSIKRLVPTIAAEPFPGLILGDNEQTTADKRLSETAREVLQSEPQFQFSYNHPFKGGHITRYFSAPAKGIHTLQLEMAQDLYMDEKDDKYLPGHAKNIQAILMTLMQELALSLKAMT